MCHTVQPIINNVTDVFGWILWEALLPFGCSYVSIVINLYDVFTFSNAHVNPIKAHFKLLMLAMSCMLHAFLLTLHDAVSSQKATYALNGAEGYFSLSLMNNIWTFITL